MHVTLGMLGVLRVHQFKLRSLELVLNPENLGIQESGNWDGHPKESQKHEISEGKSVLPKMSASLISRIKHQLLASFGAISDRFFYGLQIHNSLMFRLFSLVAH